MKAKINKNLLFFLTAMNQETYCIVNSHCAFALLPAFYLIKAIHLNSQPDYLSEGQWPNKGTSDNAFFCGSQIGFFHEEKEVSTLIGKGY